MVLLTNFIYENGFDYDARMDVEYQKEVLKDIDTSDNEGKEEYASLAADIAVQELLDNDKYQDSWQQHIINNFLFDDIYVLKLSEMGIVSSDEEKEALNNYTKKVESLEKGDWKYFVQEEKRRYQEEYDNIYSSREKEYLQKIIDMLDYRLIKDIKYEDNYLNDAINSYIVACQDMMNFSKDYEALTDEEKNQYDNVNEQLLLNQYVIENKENILGYNTNHYVLMNFFQEYGFLLLLIVIVVASSIVSSEFSKGTIKNLLIRPASRTKILLSKYLTVLSMILVSFVVILGLQIIIGGLILDFKSLSLPAVSYDAIHGVLEKRNILGQVGLGLVGLLPMYIILATLAFLLSTVASTSLASTITIISYIISGVVEAFRITFKIKILDFFVGLNWDWTPFVLGFKQPYGLSFPFSLTVCLVYLVVMLVIAFIAFRKRNIKNI